jgi:Flp pilus assembly pilin Flp
MWSSAYLDELSELEEMENSSYTTTKEDLEMKVNDMIIKAWTKLLTLDSDRRGQGTVEYVILVGVLVVIAIGAIMLFSDKIDTLWGNISDGINGLPEQDK